MIIQTIIQITHINIIKNKTESLLYTKFKFKHNIQGSVNKFCTIDNTEIYLIDTKVVLHENITQICKIKNILFNVASIT